MTHAGHDEQAQIGATVGLHGAFIVVDGGEGRRTRIVESVPQKQLATPLEERRQLRRARFVLRGKRRAMNGRLLRLDVELRRIEARRAEHQRDQVSQVAIHHVTRPRDGWHDRIPTSLATARESIVSNDPSPGPHRSIRLLERLHLRGREATVGRNSLFALQRLRFPPAATRIGDHAVFQAVRRIASFQHGVVHELDLLERNRRARRLEDLITHRVAGLYEQAVDRRTGDHSVIVLRITLRLHHAHPPAGRAPGVVALGRGATVITGDNLFAQHGHLMDCAVAKIRDCHRVVGRPRDIARQIDRQIERMTAIGPRSGVAT